MTRNFYQVTKDGKDIPGVRWATEKMAKDTLEIEMDCDLQELQKLYPNDNYTSWLYREEGFGIIRKERHEPVMEGVETIYSTEIHRYGIRVGEVGEEKKRRYEMAMDFASK